jgi:hypothetical protein
MKTCFKCLAEKPLTEFYKHPAMADGHLGKCKECAKADSRKRGSNPDYERARANLPHRVALRKRYQQSAAGRVSTRNTRLKYVKANPLKRAAHVAVGNAVRDGKLMRKPCEVCQRQDSHAHHDDYSKPLEVRWLCPPHHQQWHSANGEGRNAA